MKARDIWLLVGVVCIIYALLRLFVLPQLMKAQSKPDKSEPHTDRLARRKKTDLIFTVVSFLVGVAALLAYILTPGGK